jgi:hypothetical protein
MKREIKVWIAIVPIESSWPQAQDIQTISDPNGVIIKASATVF